MTLYGGAGESKHKNMRKYNIQKTQEHQLVFVVGPCEGPGPQGKLDILKGLYYIIIMFSGFRNPTTGH